MFTVKHACRLAVAAGLLAAVTGVLLTGASVPGAARGAGGPLSTLHAFGELIFQGTDQTRCYYRNYLFGKNVRARYALLDNSVFPPTQLQPPAGNPPFIIDGSGIYSSSTGDPNGLSPTAASNNRIVRVVCDGTTYDIPVDPNGLDVSKNLQMSNTAPQISKAVAGFQGSEVRGVPPGATVRLRVIASDANSDPLSFTWRVTAGRLNAATGETVLWTLPSSRGLHFAYVLVTDGNGAYKEARVDISTDAGVLKATKPPAEPRKPSDKLTASDHFLTFFSTFDDKGADSRRGACQYYLDIGAVQGCTDSGNLVRPITFSQWLSKWGFGGAGEKSAIYANFRDLNLQRNMHGIRRSGTAICGRSGSCVAFYVCNHQNSAGDADLTNAILNKRLVACVAMEDTVTPSVSNQPFTKFLTFGPDGKLISSVNLDGRGEKFMPGACVVCHGAQGFVRYAEDGSSDPNFDAQFLPFDMDNFKYSSRAGLRRNDLQKPMFDLNKLVLQTNPAIAIRELIQGWYPNDAPPFQSQFVPPGWAGHEFFYRISFRRACRTCHVAQIPSFNTFSQFAAFSSVIANYVCGNRNGGDRTLYAMPNALTAFDDFWFSPDQRSAMLAFLHDNGQGNATCNPPGLGDN